MHTRTFNARIGAIAVALATFSAARVQVFAQEITIVPQLRAGDAFQLELTRNRENSAQTQQNGRSRTVIDVRVISVGPEGYVLDWVPGETVLDNRQVAENPLFRAAMEAVRDLHLQLTLNAEGELTGLGNQADVLPKLKASVDAIVGGLSATVPPEQRQTVLGVVNQILSPQALIASATREAGVYFGLNGVSLTPGEIVQTEIEQPSLVGGGTIPATFTVLMESATAESASLKTTTTYDKAALLRVTELLAKQAGVQIPPDALDKMPPLEMSDEGAYVFDRTSGLMREVVVSRRVGAGNSRRVDGWQIRLVDGPQR